MTYRKHPKWFTRQNFWNWLSLQKDDDTFKYISNTDCVFARFIRSIVGDKVYISVGSTCQWMSLDGKHYPFPTWASKLEDAILNSSVNNITIKFSVVKKAYIAIKFSALVGKQYGYASSAHRAIRRYRTKHFASIPKGYKFAVNKIDDGCYEIIGYN